MTETEVKTDNFSDSGEVKKAEESHKYINPLYAGKLRNKPCICSSGKKMKKCHGRNRVISHLEMEELKEIYNAKK